MTDYKINGHVVTESAWTSFKEFMVGEFSSSVEGCFDDSEVSKDEILGILDADGNGLLDYADFISINKSQFSTLDNILKKHGFSIDKEVGQNVSGYKKPESFLSHMWKDKQFVLAAVKQNGRALQYADESLRKDRQFVLAAVKENGYALEYADELFKKDKDVVLAAVKQNGWALEYADESLIGGPDFIYSAACVRIGILNYKWISEDVKKEVWAKILKECNNFEEINPPANSLAIFKFKKYIKEKYDIEFLDRFRSVSSLVEILKIRNNPLDPSDTRPLAVIISPKKDSNGALGIYPLIDRLIELGYKVVYYEAGDETMAEGYLSEATDGGKTKADIIVLSGHGSSKTLSLGGADLGSGGTMTNEKLYIDTSDFKDGKADINLAKYLSPDGDLVLNSCLNGAGGIENLDNLANTIASILPKGVTIHASDQSMNIRHIGLDDVGKPKVEWTENSLYTPNGNGTSGK